MKLSKITILNYKSIENLEFSFNKSKGNRGVYGYLGINEAGKSNILKAISMKDNLKEFTYINSQRKESGSQVQVIYEFDYSPKGEELKELILNKRNIEIPDEFFKKIKIKFISITITIEENNAHKSEIEFNLESNELVGWTRDPTTLVKKDETKEANLDIKKFLDEELKPKLGPLIPKIIFWKSEDKYLMSSTINLDKFKENPENESIPLKNCFIISGYEDIKKTIDKSNSDPGFKGDLYEDISKKVTDFINGKWPEHKVELKFEESGGSLNFFVKNIDGKRQGVNARSDGFRQFISFLLTSSAEVKSGALKDQILIIDEPEVHLHPTSQENLLKELLAIADKNLILFATHSSYLIYKQNFSNYFRVSKIDEKTVVEPFENKITTFSEVNYEVFGIATTDYHNELYGWCEEHKKTELDGLPKNKPYKKIKQDGSVAPSSNISLAEFIRHQIHHPENTHNIKYTEKELKTSIDTLRGLKYGSN